MPYDPDAIRETHAMVDRAVAAIIEHGTTPDGRKVRATCAKGCPACCYEPVYAERSEARLLAAAVRKSVV